MSTLDRIEEHLTALNLRYRRLPDRITVGFNGANTVYEIGIHDGGSMAVLVVQGLLTISPARDAEALRLVNRLNSDRVPFGMFYITPDLHQLGFRLTLAITDGPPSQSQIDLALWAIGAVDAFFPAFARCVWGGLSAEEALADPPADPPADQPPDTDRPDLDLAV
jgi:hypothetical protein